MWSICGTSAQAQVTVVPVNNSGFENPPQADNSFSPITPGTGGNIPGYFSNQNGQVAFGTGSNGLLVGITDPEGTSNGTFYTGDTPTGQYAGILNFLDNGFGLITQQLATTVQPNTIYTLKLNVGSRKGEPFPMIGTGDTGGNVRSYLAVDMIDAAGNATGSPEAFASLTAVGASLIATRPAPAADGSAISLWTLTYTTPATIPAAFLNKQITFDFVSGDLFSGSTQIDNSVLIDEISVTTAPVPEPATVGLLAAGALLLGGRRRRSM